jgi:hypothetical protein
MADVERLKFGVFEIEFGGILRLFKKYPYYYRSCIWRGIGYNDMRNYALGG